MSFSSLRYIDAISSRRDHFWRIFLSGLPEEFSLTGPTCLAMLRDFLQQFRLGLLTYPFRDQEPTGIVSIFKLPNNAPDKTVTDALYPPSEATTDLTTCPKFHSVGSVDDFLSDYFGLKGQPMNVRTLKKKYRSAFPYSYLPINDIPDFAVLIMRAARLIALSPLIFDDPTAHVSIRPGYNEVEIARMNHAHEIPVPITTTTYF